MFFIEGIKIFLKYLNVPYSQKFYLDTEKVRSTDKTNRIPNIQQQTDKQRKYKTIIPTKFYYNILSKSSIKKQARRKTVKHVPFCSENEQLIKIK